MNQPPTPFWSIPNAGVLQQLHVTAQGLTSDEARRRLLLYGPNLLRSKARTDSLALLLGQFKSPIIIILFLAAGLSFFLRDAVDAVIILAIVVASGLLGFWQERGAADAVQKLVSIVQVKANVRRAGEQQAVPIEEIVPGDVVILAAGDVIPGDCLLVESVDLYVDEATLTGETFPVEKTTGILPEQTPLSERTNSLFMGTHVVSGSAVAVVLSTGKATEFGKVSERLRLRPPETDFERGVRRFGFLLMEVTLILVMTIFFFNVFFNRPVLDSFLFALALAVGLTPQLLPAIISINLAHGAKRMAEKKVIVKRLASIENFGSINVLCCDKTGTLTEGVVRLHSALAVDGKESEKVLYYAYLNAFFETGFANPIDKAIRGRKLDVSDYKKQDEVPYDFIRKRLSVVVTKGSTHLMVTKGALANILDVCSTAEASEGTTVLLGTVREQIQQRYRELSGQGLRVLGIAYRDVGLDPVINRDDEVDMTFLGFLALFDPPKPGIAATIKQLSELGVALKIITGDNRLVAANVGAQMGSAHPRILTGGDLLHLSDEALRRRVGAIDIFAEVEPNQKERIILALSKTGNVVGYLGDGINDASALHAADVGLSVESAVDVAKEAADIVLLEKDLGVLVEGVREGRATFANTLKYVFMATSANFGNMFSMAGASLLLPFLPLLPKQILLTNLLTDFPEMGIATDSVDQEMVEKPRRWDVRFIRNFMLMFGSVSSIFDFLTFGVLLFILRATPGQFRSGWFVESVISASVIVLVIRTRRPFFRSRPGKQLLAATAAIVGLTLLLPYSPVAGIFGFEPLPLSFLFFLIVIVLLYIAATEWAKTMFYERVKY